MKNNLDSIDSLAKCQTLLKKEIKTYQDWPKAGVDFKDIQSILSDVDLRRLTNKYLTDLLPNDGSQFTFDKILMFDARGFIFGTHLADFANAPVVMARKPGKLPGNVIRQEFEKEYGKDAIEIQSELIMPGDRILIHDDLLATGGTAAAAAELILKCGGIVAGFNFVMELDFLSGRGILQQYVGIDEIKSLVIF